MADNRHLYGFRWIRSKTGVGQPKLISKIIASHLQPDATGSVNLNPGDPVRLASTGGIVLAALGESIYGIFAGMAQVKLTSGMRTNSFYPGATAYGASSGDLYPLELQSQALVIPAIGNIFEIDCDEATTATTRQAYEAFIGENCDHLLLRDVTDTANPKANPMLDISGHLTSTMGWRIEGISTSFANQDFSGNYVKLYVSVNESQEAGLATASGT